MDKGTGRTVEREARAAVAAAVGAEVATEATGRGVAADTVATGMGAVVAAGMETTAAERAGATSSPGTKGTSGASR